MLGNEGDRLRALADYHILDTQPEQAFDDLAKLAAQICGCEVALVTLVDKDRQWFKSRIGTAMTETPREHSVCAHAIATPNNLLVVPDLTLDGRFSGNPYVRGNPNFRFYAGAPILSMECHGLGTVCVLDKKPRQLTEAQLGGLRILGRQVSYLLELRRVNRALAQALEKTRAPRS